MIILNNMEDLYQVLGVAKDATPDQIKKAYRDAAFKYHPDRNAGDTTAEEKFKQISAAYSVLGDETKRASYDRYGSADAYAQASRSQSGYGQDGYSQSPFGDDFWSWYQQQSQQQSRYQQNTNRHTYSYSNSNWTKRPQTRKEAFSSLVKNILTLLLGLFFIRYSWIILPFGPIICLIAIVNGFSGTIRALSDIITPKKQK